MELLDLDEDSLMEIFSYFTFNELLSLSVVCARFLQLCQRHLRKIRHFELNYRLVIARDNYAEYVRNVFTSLGPTMAAFRFSGGYIMDEGLKQCIVSGLSTHCTNLQHLTINYTILGGDHLRSLAVLLRTLVTLDLGRCDLEDDGLAELLQTPAQQLRILAIPGNSNLMGTFLKRWTAVETLEQLDVSYCSSLNIHEMEGFLRHAKRLKAVDATGSLWLQRNKDIFRKENRSITMGTSMEELQYFNAG